MLRARVAGALEGSAEDVLAAHRALAAALDADPDDAELRRLHRELVDEGAIARLTALERVRAASAAWPTPGRSARSSTARPARPPPPLDLDRVLLSRIDDGWLVAEALHCEGDAKAAARRSARLRDAPVQIAYPLIEGELLRRRRAGGRDRRRRRAGTRQAFWDGHALDAPTSPRRSWSRAASSASCTATAPTARAPLRAARRRGAGRFADGLRDGLRARRPAPAPARPAPARCGASPAGPTAAARELSDGAIDLARDRRLADGEDARPPARGALGAGTTC